MVQYEWDEEKCRQYANKMEGVVKYDHRPWAKRIAEHLTELPKDAKVMDVATGPGLLLLEVAQMLPEVELIAQDEAEPMLKIATERAKARGTDITTVASPAESIPVDDGSLDVVMCKQLLHECHDVDQVIGELSRVLKPGGKAFVIDFNAEGSKIAAGLIWLFIRITQGREGPGMYWKSFKAALPGSQVRDKLLAAGFDGVDYTKSGPNYFMFATKKQS